MQCNEISNGKSRFNFGCTVRPWETVGASLPSSQVSTEPQVVITSSAASSSESVISSQTRSLKSRNSTAVYFSATSRMNSLSNLRISFRRRNLFSESSSMYWLMILGRCVKLTTRGTMKINLTHAIAFVTLVGFSHTANKRARLATGGGLPLAVSKAPGVISTMKST